MSAPAVSPTTPLTAKEQERFEELEFVIRRGWKTFVEVGQALKEINTSRLYRARFRSFEEYCQEVWGWTRQRAYQLIDGAETAATLAQVGLDVKSEREARTLKPLAREVARTPASERTPATLVRAKLRAAEIPQAPRPSPSPAPVAVPAPPAQAKQYSVLCSREGVGWRAVLWFDTTAVHTCQGATLAQVGRAMDAFLQEQEK